MPTPWKEFICKIFIIKDKDTQLKFKKKQIEEFFLLKLITFATHVLRTGVKLKSMYILISIYICMIIKM